MSNILEQTRSSRQMDELKAALAGIGVDVECINNTADVAAAIRENCVPAGTVLNASLAAGPGVKIAPIDRKGYKISANSDAVLTQDLTNDLTKGTAIQKALYRIVHHMIPEAIHTAVCTPYIVGIEVFKSENDGVDFYDNRAFGKKGTGRKSGLHPYEWYLKIYTTASVEPLYVGLGNMLQDVKRDFLCDAAHQADHQFSVLMQEHLQKYHGKIWESRPERPSHDWDCDKPLRPGHPGCDRPERPEHSRPDKPGHCRPERPELPGDDVDDDDDCPICDPKEEGYDTDSLSNFIYNLTMPNHK